MLIDGAAYSRLEWERQTSADYERTNNGEWLFLGEPFSGTVEGLFDPYAPQEKCPTCGGPLRPCSCGEPDLHCDSCGTVVPT
jgi:hypothetical protein